MNNNIMKTEFSDEFVELMKNRMLVSFYKYGPIAEGFPHKINAIASLTDRLRKYAETGNTEFLVDAANFAMIEFMLPSHPDAFFKGTDDDQSPGRRLVKGTISKQSNSEAGTNPNSKTAKFRGDT